MGDSQESSEGGSEEEAVRGCHRVGEVDKATVLLRLTRLGPCDPGAASAPVGLHPRTVRKVSRAPAGPGGVHCCVAWLPAAPPPTWQI